jgi:four helix bundle protein
MKIRDYRGLKAWQVGIELDAVCYRISFRLPCTERYGLARQIRDAAGSIPANIAEGNSRRHLKEHLQFVGMARASAAELRSHLQMCASRRLLSPAECEPGQHLTERVLMLVTGLQRALERKLDSQ